MTLRRRPTAKNKPEENKGEDDNEAKDDNKEEKQREDQNTRADQQPVQEKTTTTTTTNGSNDDKTHKHIARASTWEVLFLVTALVVLYMSNGLVLVGMDATANIFLPFQMLRNRPGIRRGAWKGGFSPEGWWDWEPEDNPILFGWMTATTKELLHPSTTVHGPLIPWQKQFKKRNSNNATTFLDMIERGEVAFTSPKYLVVESKRPGTTSNKYVNTFNFGAALTYLPVVATLAWLRTVLVTDSFTSRRFDESLNVLQEENPRLLFTSSKLLAAALVAWSAAFVYLSALLLLDGDPGGGGKSPSSVPFPLPSRAKQQALTIALSYALGTLVWARSSQGLYQHAPCEFYISLAVWAMLKTQQQPQIRKGAAGEWYLAAMCGFAVGMAVLSRPTLAIIAVAIGIHYFLQSLSTRSGKLLLSYGISGAILAVLQMYYNHYYFNNPFEFGQQVAGRKIALTKTGKEDLWSTPFWTGLSTLLLSPNRGLFIFSPFAFFCMPWLFFYVWKRPQKLVHKALRPLSVSVLVLWCVAFKFMDFWGGQCYGYRPLVDTMPLLVLFLVPAMPAIWDRPWLFLLFCLTVIWSVWVQYVGAFGWTASFTYWNNRPGTVFRSHGNATSEWALYDCRPGVPNRWIPNYPDEARLAEKYPDVTPAHDVILDIDIPEFRSRFWDWSDSQILFTWRCMNAAHRKRIGNPARFKHTFYHNTVVWTYPPRKAAK